MDFLADQRTRLVTTSWVRKPTYIGTEATRFVRHLDECHYPNNVWKLAHGAGAYCVGQLVNNAAAVARELAPSTGFEQTGRGRAEEGGVYVVGIG